jgi:hypothetical protein
MMFAVSNLESFQTNFSVHGMNMTNRTHLHRPLKNLACFQQGVSYSGKKIFNSLPTNILELKNDKLCFKAVLWKYLIIYSFYCIEEFLYSARMSSTSDI